MTTPSGTDETATVASSEAPSVASSDASPGGGKRERHPAFQASSGVSSDASSVDGKPPVARAPETPSAGTIAAALAAAGREHVTLHLFDELPSTSRWLEARAADGHAADVAHGAPPALCTVDLQSAGHGRRGKRWVSVPGNVAVSLLEHLPLGLADLGGLSLVTGIAVADALGEATGLDVRIKWPNDLLVDGAKLGGLLIGVQVCGTGGGTGGGAGGGAGGVREPCTRVVTGIGINVVHDPRVEALGIGGTSIVGTVDRDRLLGTIAARVLDAHERFAALGWAAFADAWRSRDALVGRDVDIHLDGEVLRGRALGVDIDGALRVSIDGTERNFHGGDVSVRPHDSSATGGTLS